MGKVVREKRYCKDCPRRQLTHEHNKKFYGKYYCQGSSSYFKDEEHFCTPRRKVSRLTKKRQKYDKDKPSIADLRSPLFNTIWKAIKGWDISLPHQGGICSATGTHTMLIANAIKEQRGEIVSLARIKFEDLKEGMTIYDARAKNYMILVKLIEGTAKFRYVAKGGATIDYEVTSKVFNDLPLYEIFF